MSDDAQGRRLKGIHGSAQLESRGAISAQRGIAFVCHPYHRGGVTRWMVDAAVEFRRRRLPVWFIAPEPRSPLATGADRPTMASLLRRLSPLDQPTIIAPLVGVPFELGTHSYRAAFYAHTLEKDIPIGTPCIVSDDPAAWAGVAGVSESYPMIGVLHSDEGKYYALAATHKGKMAICVGVSKRVAAKASRTGIATTAIPCGVPMRRLCEASIRRESIARIVWIGRLEEKQKRVSDLPRIAERLRERGIAFTMTIVGDGPEKRLVQRELELRGLQREVNLVGWLDSDSIWSLLCASDVLVLPSNYEGTPIVMMEALSAGCVVVASIVSGVEDFAEHPLAANTLFVHAVGDVESATDLVLRALRLPPLERRRVARQIAEEEFSIRVCIDRYQEALSGVRQEIGVKPQRRRTLVVSALSWPVAMGRAVHRAVRRRMA